MSMSKEAQAARRAAAKAYRENHREQLRAYNREWRRNNPDKVKASRERYWERKAREAAAASESSTSGNVLQD